MDFVVTSQKATPTSAILVCNGRRTIIHNPGLNDADPLRSDEVDHRVRVARSVVGQAGGVRVGHLVQPP